MSKSVSFLLFIISLISEISAQFQTHHHENLKVLVFSATAGFRHESIESGIAALNQLATDKGFEIDASEDAALFSFENLVQYDAVIFLSTTGDILNDHQQQAFEAYINQGGGYVGIHAASDTEYDWPWYGELVGAYFESHPSIQPATLIVSDRVHPSTKRLPERWIRTDEWYNFQSNPRGDVHVLATLDEDTYSGGNMGYDHPIAWCHEFDGGRAWYTGGGHTNESYEEQEFMEHIYGGVLYASGRVNGIFDATVEKNFQRTILDSNPLDPIALDILPNGDVIYIERGGKVKRINVDGTIELISEFDVVSNNEDGLIGIVLDPNFESNNWIYFFYSPNGEENVQHVSRIKYIDNSLERETEQIILKIPVQREQCCHSGGDMEFDSQGNLYIGVGDNTNPFESNGYAPLDERNGRNAFDAQRTSGNTKDLRGKILRIKPNEDGSYSIPEGNLFTDSEEGLPEIFVMGTRNPYRMAIDTSTNVLYWGDVGPDSGGDSGSRGSQGYDEWNKTSVAGNFGWPYCIGNNFSYIDYDFETGESGVTFDCENPVNNSINNTGITNLPSSVPAWIWYPYGEPPAEFAELGFSTGRTSMAGEVYHYDSSNSFFAKLPAYFDNSLILYEWSNNYFKEVKLDQEGEILSINPFLDNFDFAQPIDMDFGPDGAIYIVEWGFGFGSGNPGSKIIKINFSAGNQTPVANASATPTFGTIPLEVNFSSSGSFDTDEDPLTYNWDFDGDGSIDSNEENPTFTYTENGVFNASLQLSDGKATGFSIVQIIVGNNAPEVNITSPMNGGFYDWGDVIPYKVEVIDQQDGSTTDGEINCDDVLIRPAIGHNDHAHDQTSLNGCEGTYQTASGHGTEFDKVFYVINAFYEDAGLDGNENFRLNSSATVVLKNKRLQAEHFDEQVGLEIEPTNDSKGGQHITSIESGDYLLFKDANLSNMTHITYRSASGSTGGYAELRLDAPDGELLSRRYLPGNSDWGDYDFYVAPIKEKTTTHDLYIHFNSDSDQQLFNLNWMDFFGDGIAVNKIENRGFKAYYYNDNFEGDPIVEEHHPLINFDWEDQLPNESITNEKYSIVWTGLLSVPSSETYTLYLQLEGGVGRLMVDENLILEANSTEEVATSIDLDVDSPVKLDLNYIHIEGNSSISLKWSTQGTTKNTIPMDVLNITDQDPFVYQETPVITSIQNTTTKIFPNPAMNSIKIATGLPSFKAELFTINGQLLKTQYYSNSEGSLNLSSYKSGIYFIRVSNGQGFKPIFEKIVIDR